VVTVVRLLDDVPASEARSRIRYATANDHRPLFLEPIRPRSRPEPVAPARMLRVPLKITLGSCVRGLARTAAVTDWSTDGQRLRVGDLAS